jgi:DNA polymerase I-like protein with 3'-5' exonuclease and polymerase domains
VIPIQVHDELVLEVDPSVVKEAALLLQMSMENAALLLGICSVSIVHISLYSENLSFLYFISLFVFQFLCMSN